MSTKVLAEGLAQGYATKNRHTIQLLTEPEIGLGRSSSSNDEEFVVVWEQMSLPMRSKCATTTIGSGTDLQSLQIHLNEDWMRGIDILCQIRSIKNPKHKELLNRITLTYCAPEHLMHITAARALIKRFARITSCAEGQLPLQAWDEFDHKYDTLLFPDLCLPLKIYLSPENIETTILKQRKKSNFITAEHLVRHVSNWSKLGVHENSKITSFIWKSEQWHEDWRKREESQYAQDLQCRLWIICGSFPLLPVIPIPAGQHTSYIGLLFPPGVPDTSLVETKRLQDQYNAKGYTIHNYFQPSIPLCTYKPEDQKEYAIYEAILRDAQLEAKDIVLSSSSDGGGVQRKVLRSSILIQQFVDLSKSPKLVKVITALESHKLNREKKIEKSPVITIASFVRKS
jgi:hypothetical protein